MLRTTHYGQVVRFDLARTMLGRGRYWTAAYLVDQVLIDTGCAHTSDELVRALSGHPLRAILNTHSHEDHIGANGPLQRADPDLKVHAHPAALEVMAEPRRRQPLHPYRRVMWGWPEPSRGRPIHDREVVEVGTLRFQAISTPGHSPDHYCYFEPARGWLFTGDLFVGGRERALRADYDIWGIIASLKEISRLPASVMFPASARVREDPTPALVAKIGYLEGLGGKVLDLSRRGASVRRTARELCGKPMLMEAVTLGHFSRRALVRSYLARVTDRRSRTA